MAFSVEFQFRVWKLLYFFLEEEKKGKVRGHVAGCGELDRTGTVLFDVVQLGQAAHLDRD
jgi:hypothetical protein